MTNLLVAMPLYNAVTTAWLVNWMGMDKTGTTGTVLTDGSSLLPAMESLIEQALEKPDWDRLVVMEQDMIPPSNAFSRILQYQPKHAVVGSLYFAHRPPHDPYVYLEGEETGFAQVSFKYVDMVVNQPGLHPVAGVGFGFTSIAREVLEKWPSDVPMFRYAAPFTTHDLWFCQQARNQGYKVFVDSEMFCEHMSAKAIGYEDYVRENL